MNNFNQKYFKITMKKKIATEDDIDMAEIVL